MRRWLLALALVALAARGQVFAFARPTAPAQGRVPGKAALKMTYTFDEPEWVALNGAQIGSEGPVHSGANALLITGNGSPLNNQAALIPIASLAPLTTYAITGWVYSNGAQEDTPVVLFVSTPNAVAVRSSLNKSVAGPGWVRAGFGSFKTGATPSGFSLGVTLGNVGAATHGAWAVDDIEISETTATESAMPLDREPIYVTLFSRLQSDVAGFTTMSRIFRLAQDVLAAEQPALFLMTGDEIPENKLGVPTTWLLYPEVWMYFRRDDNTQIPGTQINAAKKAIEAALEWRPADLVPGAHISPTGRTQTTLGGAVEFARIHAIETVEGALQQQALVKVTLEMRAV